LKHLCAPSVSKFPAQRVSSHQLIALPTQAVTTFR
jgi:hypothetical protein